jgi:hypothetical protein
MNLDCSDRPVDRLVERLELIHRQSGAPVSLVGHSRDGHFAKALATRRRAGRPGDFDGRGARHALRLQPPHQGRAGRVRAAHTRTTDRVSRNGCLTGSCRWRRAPFLTYANCVEVTGSHIGLACNRDSYRAIGEALAAEAASSGG